MKYIIKTLKEIKQCGNPVSNGYNGFGLFFHEDMLSECGSILSKEEISSIKRNGSFIRMCNNHTFIFESDMISKITVPWLH